MEKYKICPSCGKHNTTKAIECRYCEMSLAGVKPTDDETEAARAEAEAKKKEEENNGQEPFGASLHAGQMTRVCSECGAHNPPNARKCISCGEDISDVIPTEEVEPQPVKTCRYILQDITGTYVYEIPADGCVVGRENAMSDYLSAKMYVSRRHAKLKIQDDRLMIEHIGNKNSTYVNNEEVTGVQELKNNDEIGFGGNMTGGKRQDLAAYFIVKQE